MNDNAKKRQKRVASEGFPDIIAPGQLGRLGSLPPPPPAYVPKAHEDVVLAPHFNNPDIGDASINVSGPSAHERRYQYNRNMRALLRNQLLAAVAEAEKTGGALPVPSLDVSSSLSDAKRRKKMTSSLDTSPVPNYDADYSYMDAPSLAALRERQARRGIIFRRKPRLPPVEETAGSAPARQLGDEINDMDNHKVYIFSDKAANMPRTQVTEDGVTIIKLRSEAYYFKERVQSKPRPANATGPIAMYTWVVRGVDGDLVEKELYGDELEEHEESLQLTRCTFLRANNNNIVSLKNFSKDVKSFLFRPFLYLTIVDLSSNKIQFLPDTFDGIPIQSLLLHSNQISELEEVAKLKDLQASLQKLTLYENPLQRQLHPHYKSTILSVLPFLTALDNTPFTTLERDAQDVKNRMCARTTLPPIRKR